MTLLLDTHLLLWAVDDPARLSSDAWAFLGDPAARLTFSVASIWEVAIKKVLGKPDFYAELKRLRESLKGNGFSELEIKSKHAIAVASLPPIHKDPFDRLLVAQASVEGFTLLTSDGAVAEYSESIRKV